MRMAELRPERRVCVDSAKKGGRIRCLKWEVQREPLPEVVVARPSDEEIQVLAGQEDLVKTRGALPEFGRNGRYEGLVQRLAGDLKAYVGQPANPALCSGGIELLDFHQAEHIISAAETEAARRNRYQGADACPQAGARCDRSQVRRARYDRVWCGGIAARAVAAVAPGQRDAKDLPGGAVPREIRAAGAPGTPRTG